MKLEQLASLLESDATELQGTLNLETLDSEVDSTEAVKLIKDHIREVKVQNLSKGKTQAEGRAKKEARTEVENILKETFKVDGLFDEQVKLLQSKLSKKPKVETVDDSELKKSLQAKDLKILELEKAVKLKEDEFANFEVKAKVKSKIKGLLGGYEFASDYLKDKAIEDFMDNKKFELMDDGIILYKDGVPTTLFEKELDNTLSNYGKKVEEKKKVQATEFKKDSTKYSDDMTQLIKDISNAKTPEAAAPMRAKLKELIDASKD